MNEALQVFEQVVHCFGLLADPARLRILSRLRGEEGPVSEVVEKVGLTQANISRHLNILYRAGVVDRRQEGISALYRVADRNSVEICGTVGITVPGWDMGEQMGSCRALSGNGFNQARGNLDGG